MPDILTVLTRWWKYILTLVISVAIIAALVLSFKKKQYLSTVTALPANSVTFDKGRIFNNNIDQLYSSIGTSDELDPVIGTARVDTIFISLVRMHNLVNHYGTGNKKYPEAVAIKYLKGNSSVAKDEFGTLKIKVWDIDPVMAATLAHSYFEVLQNMHQSLQTQANTLILSKLKENLASLTGHDSTETTLDTMPVKITNIPDYTYENEFKTNQVREYQKLISDYTTAISTKPQALLLADDARPGTEPDRPKFWLTFSIAVLGALLFGILLALFLESRK